MTDWQTVPMGELCSIQSGKSDSKDAVADGPYAFFDRSRSIKRSSRFLRDCEALIIPGEGAEFLPRHFVGKFDLHQRAYALFDFSSRIEVKFLYHYLHHLADYFPSVAVGATVKSLRLRHFEQLPVKLTDLATQRRIVAVLDEAFEGIATAKANAEKNLQNARGVFESYLQDAYTVRVGHLPRRRLEGLCEKNRLITYGVIKLGDPIEGGVPCLRTSNVRWLDIDTNGMKRIAPTLAAEYSRTILRGGEVLVNVRGTLGGVAVVPDDMAGWNVSREVAVVPVDADMLDAEYAAFWIGSRTSQDWLSGVKKGAAYTGINIEDLRNLPVPLPGLEAQRAIVDDVLAIRDATRRIEEIYRSKLDALDELKESLLHQAFSGQLTSTKNVPIAAAPALRTTSPQFSANIIALAYARHMRQQRERTFGRVKEQKLLHLVEAIGKVDLGRQPMKDAAGPNDFQHMLKAEDWARRNNFFELTQREGGYDFRRLSAFDKLLASAPHVLGCSLDRIEPVIDLMVSMDKEEVEVFATVHAAWNNLLIDGAEVTDDAIVREARDGWHADKLAISEGKFRQAIALIRRKSLMPDGSGKYVGGQKPLAFR